LQPVKLSAQVMMMMKSLSSDDAKSRPRVPQESSVHGHPGVCHDDDDDGKKCDRCHHRSFSLSLSL
jgi:hypothetical protein